MTFSSGDIDFEILDPLVRRKVLPSSESLMLVEVHFRKGGVGAVHEHEGHEQVSYVLSGRFEARIGDEVRILGRGDGFVAGRHTPHGLVALEDSVVLDAFTPIRKDFL